MSNFNKAMFRFLVGYTSTFFLCGLLLILIVVGRWFFHGLGGVNTFFDFYPVLTTLSFVVGLAHAALGMK